MYFVFVGVSRNLPRLQDSAVLIGIEHNFFFLGVGLLGRGVGGALLGMEWAMLEAAVGVTWRLVGCFE